MNDLFEAVLVVVLAATCVAGGYSIGINENREPPKYDLPESMYDEIHAYRLCMQTPSCRMFTRVDK